MKYRQGVARARVLVGRSEEDQWELARLTFEHTTGPESKSLREWAADVGIGKSHAAYLAEVWRRYGAVHRGGHDATRAFAEYYTLARRSVPEAEILLEEAERTGRSVTTLERRGRRRDPVRSLLRNRRRLRDVIQRDRKAREILEDELRQHRQREVSTERGTDRPTQADGDLDDELDALTAEMDSVLAGLAETKLDKAERRRYLARYQGLANRMEWMGAYLKTGDRALAEKLDDVLAGKDVIDSAEPRPRQRKATVDPATEDSSSAPTEATDPVTTPPPTDTGAGRKKRRNAGDRRPDQRPPGDRLKERGVPAGVP